MDVLGIARAEGFEVRESDHLGEDQAGETFSKGDRHFIVVNKRDHPFRRRFTVLHEMAHHVLSLPSAHGSTLPSGELERFRSRPSEEVLCDVFAAECLVPWQLMKPLTEEFEFTAASIETLSQWFEASRPCVASRFARGSDQFLAYVVAEDGTIKYPVSSNAVRDANIWLRNGVPLPKSSAAMLAMTTGQERAAVNMEGSDWSDSDAADRFSVCEEAIYVASWGQTLSLLTFEEEIPAARSRTDRSQEEDELLPELTGYPSWKKK